MYELIITLDIKDKEYLADIRCYPDLLVTLDDNIIWVRGIEITENIDPNIRKLPIKSNYILGKDDNLFLVGNITPTAKLKKLAWMPINQFIQPEFPDSLKPGKIEQTYNVKFIQSDIVQESDVLVTDFISWENYSESASEVRLKPLKFAVSNSGKVIIIGKPLPSIPGKEYWIHENLLIPSGYNFEIAIIADLISAKLDPSKSFYILFDINTDLNLESTYKWEKISKENFVSASRSAIRLTSENIIK